MGIGSEHYAEAECLYQRAVVLLSKASLKETKHFALLSDNLTNLYRKQRRWSDASAMSSQALLAARAIYGESSNRVGRYLEKHAQLLVIVGDVEGAVLASREAIELMGGMVRSAVIVR